jgi:glutamate-1-semialdehyde 2,1-aminomutase
VKVVAIVQARMGSSRLPGKVLQDLGGVPLIQFLLQRLSAATTVHEIVLATSVDAANQPLRDLVTRLGYRVFSGSETDVLGRFVLAAEHSEATYVVRITGDCPFVDARLVDQCVNELLLSEVDYVSNVDPPTFPDGLDVEVFRVESLLAAHAEAVATFDREHVTPYMRRQEKFSKRSIRCSEDLSRMRWTVDDPQDLDVVRGVAACFAPRLDFSFEEILEVAKSQPELFVANAASQRNEGAVMSNGQKLWRRAKRVIPGGNMLLSKRAEMFLPEKWPSYFSRASGCTVWDLDGRPFTDMSIMGIGTNILGYGHAEVDDAVRSVISNGNMSTLNCPEEVYLAERLVEIHPWAEMARLARSGGEANAIAVRIARAASGRDKVAICGYHGWHDWYLSTNLADNAGLDGHLLPGLDPAGVPRKLAGTTLPFAYNDAEGLERLLISNPDIGVIKMEVSRNAGPASGFLQRVRDLATHHGAVLIFDECTSGFRETAGGLHLKYGVEPDMAMFGKALGNGYAITATIGRRSVMEAAQSTFISSTFWTERIGPVAALKTLEIMQRDRSYETITKTGLEIRQRWQSLAERNGLRISHWGLPALTGFTITSDKALAYKTLITQEMLKQGYLAGNSVYVSIAHQREVVDRYFETLAPIFSLIRDCEDGRDVHALLEGPVCHAGFKRLN